MKKAAREWRVYDPSKGSDRKFDIGAGRVASTAAHGIVCLEGPSINWLSNADVLDAAMVGVDVIGVVAVVPWWSKSVAVECHRALSHSFDNARVLARGSLVLATGVSPQDLASRTLHLHSRLGDRRSGLWAFGSMRSTEGVLDAVTQAFVECDSPIFAVARLLSVVNCVLCLDDGVDALFYDSAGVPVTLAAGLIQRLAASPH